MLSIPTWAGDVGTRTCLQLPSSANVKLWGHVTLNFHFLVLKNKNYMMIISHLFFKQNIIMLFDLYMSLFS